MTSEITFIGCGNMAQAMISGLSASKNRYQINIIENDQKIIDKVKDHLPIKVIKNIENIQTDIIILAVKPKDIKEVCKNLKVKDSIVVSIAAGIQLKTIEKFMNGYKKLVRVMPNLCAFEGKSINAIYFNNAIDEKSKKTIDIIFKSIGSNIIFDEEIMIDRATAISGSGPAYVFYFMQALIEAALKLGLPEEESRKLVFGTLEGSCVVAKKNIDNLNQLIKNVSSKGGTTEAAITSFAKNNFKKIIENGIKDAANRASEINDENSAS